MGPLYSLHESEVRADNIGKCIEGLDTNGSKKAKGPDLELEPPQFAESQDG